MACEMEVARNRKIRELLEITLVIYIRISKKNPHITHIDITEEKVFEDVIPNAIGEQFPQGDYSSYVF